MAKLLVDLRTRKDLNQSQLAKKLKISRTFLSMIEAGHRVPANPAQFVIAVARALELSDEDKQNLSAVVFEASIGKALPIQDVILLNQLAESQVITVPARPASTKAGEKSQKRLVLELHKKRDFNTPFFGYMNIEAMTALNRIFGLHALYGLEKVETTLRNGIKETLLFKTAADVRGSHMRPVDKAAPKPDPEAS